MVYYAAVLAFLVCQSLVDTRELLVFTVATENNDALQRFLRSAEHNQFNVKVLGLGEIWKGGDISRNIGGGQKIRLLKDELMKFAATDELVLFVDSYDVIFTDRKERLIAEYERLGYTVLFGAEGYCWPDKSLEKKYPMVGPNEKRFLNSGGFMGPASHLYRILSQENIKDDADDQLYYTEIFLNEVLQTELNIGLDTTSSIFQNLHGAFSDLEVQFTNETGYLVNTKTKTKPIIVHGNGPIKPEFNSLTNYLDYTWTPTKGCQHCHENNLDLDKNGEFPTIQLSLFVEKPTPFLDVFFNRIAALSYPKSHIHLTCRISAKAITQKPLLENFINTHGHEYASVTRYEPEDIKDEGDAWDRAIAHCLALENCQLMFSVDSVVQLTNPKTLEHLIRMNRSMIAPMLTRRGKLWSNFWGALSNDGYYERSDDYIDIVERNRIGIWNVPFLRDVFLLSRWAVRKFAEHKLTGIDEIDMQIPTIARRENIFMMVDNQQNYGYLVYAENYTTEHLYNDLWQIFDNPLDWEEQYVHPDYFKLRAPEVTMNEIEQPCPDVFYFPIVSPKFCRELIEEVEKFGLWSDGTNYDPRLEGGYENVPTRDIHMRQINWEEHWLHFLAKYVHPIQKKIYAGYDDQPRARMNFVVRYRPDEQPSLRPHHDASSYTINVALNEAGVDYQGGGTRFNRYNCSLVGPKVGWTSLFPGRVTHLHEGLTTTSGTRYIFITFVNP